MFPILPRLYQKEEGRRPFGFAQGEKKEEGRGKKKA